MKPNMGMLDRLLRTFVVGPLALVLSLAAFGAWSVLGIAALVVAGIMFVTSAIGFCPLYVPFGISTRRPVRAFGHSRVVAQH